MIFSPALAVMALTGRKTVTRRRISHRDGRPVRYKSGKVYAVQPGRGKPHVGHILVTHVWPEFLSACSWQEARREGFWTKWEFIDYWRKLHGSYDPEEPVARIAFEVAARCARCLPLETLTSL